MTERTGLYSFHGHPLTLVGDAVRVGDRAPGFRLLDTSFSPVTEVVLKGKVAILAAVPSLDTAVCSRESQRFNDEAAKLGSGVVVLTISMDLPYAQKRWCNDLGIDRVKTLSDHMDAGFGLAYGVLTKETRLLARSVFVVDREGIVRYVELVPELSHEPNYDAALAAARELLAK